MISYLAAYATVSLAGLTALCVMLMKLGALMGDCPQNGPALKVSTITIATGFAAIGAGGLTLLATILIVSGDAPFFALVGTLGLAALCLGLGFVQAVATLRAVAFQVQNPIMEEST